MLSDCQECKFFTKDGCGVNPIYYQAFDGLTIVEDDAREAIARYMEACPHWELADDMQAVAAEITLPFRAWKYLAEQRSRNPLVTPLIEKARELTGWEPSEEDDCIYF